MEYGAPQWRNAKAALYSALKVLSSMKQGFLLLSLDLRIVLDQQGCMIMCSVLYEAIHLAGF